MHTTLTTLPIDSSTSSSETPRLLIASNNPGKAAELKALLKGSGWEIVTPRDIGLELEVAETGCDYAENARIKASSFARASGLVTLADDSGLEVDEAEDGPNDSETFDFTLYNFTVGIGYSF